MPNEKSIAQPIHLKKKKELLPIKKKTMGLNVLDIEGEAKPLLIK